MRGPNRWKSGVVVVFFVAVAGIGLRAIAANSDTTASAVVTRGESALATFAGGCFWCLEGPYDKLPGVLATTSGYIGGDVVNPTYEQVSSGRTGHAEAVEIRYDPALVSYTELLSIFWRNIDPTTPDRQFCDHGSQYRPAIFYHDETQRLVARASLEDIVRTKPFKAEIKTELTAATQFFPAEDHHQDYYLKNPLRYKFYRYNCGRDQRLKQLWGNDS